MTRNPQWGWASTKSPSWSGFLTCPHQQHGAEVQTPRAHPPRKQAEEDLLGAEEREVDDPEHHQEETADELEAQAVDEKSERRRAAEGDLHRAPDLFHERRRAVAAIEAGGEQQQAPHREDQDEEEGVFLDGRDRGPEDQRGKPRQHHEPQQVGHGEGQRRQDEVPDQYAEGDCARFLLQHGVRRARTTGKPLRYYGMAALPSRRAS